MRADFGSSNQTPYDFELESPFDHPSHFDRDSPFENKNHFLTSRHEDLDSREGQSPHMKVSQILSENRNLQGSSLSIFKPTNEHQKWALKRKVPTLVSRSPLGSKKQDTLPSGPLEISMCSAQSHIPVNPSTLIEVIDQSDPPDPAKQFLKHEISKDPESLIDALKGHQGRLGAPQ